MEDKYEIVEKCWRLRTQDISEGHYLDQLFVYAPDRGKAKNLFIKSGNLDSYTIGWDRDEINYLNIPVVRQKEDDRVMFEGNVVVKSHIPKIIRERERLNELENIKSKPDIDYCFIVKRGLYYRPNSCGYTTNKLEAGVYNKGYAVRSAKSCDELTIIPINVKEYNTEIQNKINELQYKIINEG